MFWTETFNKRLQFIYVVQQQFFVVEENNMRDGLFQALYVDVIYFYVSEIGTALKEYMWG